MEVLETAGIMKKAFTPSTFLKSSDGILGMIPDIFVRADARLDGCPVIMADPLSAAVLGRVAASVARAVGAQRVAEFRDHRSRRRGDVRARVAARLLPARDGLTARR